MKTTIEMPDDLFRQAKAVAALRGQSMKQFVTQSIMASLHNPINAPSIPDGAADTVAADTFSRELATLAAQISTAWQGPHDAETAIREQRRELGNDGH
ncbi:MAG: hypothetical protein H0U72_05560 [Nitrosospira sp.]|nr:hypothetical protein [Nitrosospira sp.]